MDAEDRKIYIIKGYSIVGTIYPKRTVPNGKNCFVKWKKQEKVFTKTVKYGIIILCAFLAIRLLYQLNTILGGHATWVF